MESEAFGTFVFEFRVVAGFSPRWAPAKARDYMKFKHRVESRLKYVGDSVRFETFGSWSSSGLSTGASFSSIGFLQRDPAPSCGCDYAVRRVDFHKFCVLRPDGETLDSRTSSGP